MKLIDYQFVDNLVTFDPADLAKKAMYGYQLFEDGLFISAAKSEMEVSFPIASCKVRGLAPSLGPLFNWRLPLIPGALVRLMLAEAGIYAKEGFETLFHCCWSPLGIYDDGWDIVTPEQERTSTSCRPLDDGDGSSYQRAIVEIHSHHSMSAKFSSIDDIEEQGFRIYAVIGRLHRRPEIRVRVGVYGYFWEIPASWIMELPEGLTDCNEEQSYELIEESIR